MKLLSNEKLEALIIRHAPPIHPDFIEDDGFEELCEAIEREILAELQKRDKDFCPCCGTDLARGV